MSAEQPEPPLDPRHPDAGAAPVTDAQAGDTGQVTDAAHVEGGGHAADTGYVVAGGPVRPRPGDPDTIAAALVAAAERAPEAGVAVVDDDEGVPRLVTYPRLLERARRIAGGLRVAGVAAGDAAILQVRAIDSYVEALWGCLLAGVRPVAVAAPPDYAGPGPAWDRLTHAWRRLGRPVLIGDGHTAAALDARLRRTAGDHRPRVLELARCAEAPPADGLPAARPGDTALYMLSSGSTGAPKVIPLTQRALRELGIGAREQLGVEHGDVTFNWLPLDHSGALLLYHVLPVFAGVTNIHAPTDWVLADPLRWPGVLHRLRVAHTWAPTFGYRLVTDALRTRSADYDLGAIKTFVCGGEQITLPVVADFLRATAPFGVGPAALTAAWGMTETCTAITFGSHGAPGAVRRIGAATYASVGRPAPGAELRVVDAGGRTLPEGRVGHLQVRSARVTPGYVTGPPDGGDRAPAGGGDDGGADGPAEDGTGVPARDAADGGWFDTGDLAQLAGGRLVITGRAKDVIILNGENHPCPEIEEVAGSVPGVRAGLVAACGIPSAERGSEALAIAFTPVRPVPSSGAAVPGHAGSGDEAAEDGPRAVADAIRAALTARLGLTPAVVTAIGEAEFPRTPSGKLRRAALRDLLRERLRERLRGRPNDPPSDLPGDLPGDPPSDRPDDRPDGGPGGGRTGRAALRESVLAAFRTVLGIDLAPDRPLYEQGVDSVRVPPLAAAMERVLGRPVATTELLRHPTVDAFIAALNDPAEPSGGALTRPTPHPAGPAPADRRVAIVGMAARFPGADSLEAYWDNLCRGRESIRFFSPEELAAAGIPPDEYGHPDYVPASGVLGSGDRDTVAGFDAELFGVSAREAALLDPQQRLFLECCHEALEAAGYAASDGGDAPRIGVYAGSGMNLYSQRTYLQRNLTPAGMAADPLTAMQVTMGNQPDFLATRAAYRLGLTGPAIGVQTACSTGLVAVHLAARAVLAGDSDLAIAGAAALHLPQAGGYTYVDGAMLSRSGRCRPFDSAADGTVGGNGVAAIVVKRLDRALADGDTIHAVILGSAVNNDGATKVGFAAPSVTGQARAVTAALDAAGVTADTIGYLEAHGTGTRLGDPLEVRALTEAFGARTDPVRAGATGYCVLGSVKANIGHLDSCSGLAGLIKAALILRHGRVPPQINFDRPNPAIDLEGGPFAISTEPRDWHSGAASDRPGRAPRRAGVQALGVGGTNAHVILEEPPAPATAPADDGRPLSEPGPLVLSAHTADALDELAARFTAPLRRPAPPRLADLFVTTALGRRHRRHRLVVLGYSARALADGLEAGRGGRPTAGVVRGTVDRDGPGPTAFAFSGQGGTAGYGFVHALYQRFDAFRRTLDRCAGHYQTRWGGDLRTPLLTGGGGSGDGEPWEADLAQPALFTVQVALAEMWADLGVGPDYVVGHSAGEYAAWCVAGALSPEDGLDLVTFRGRLMREYGRDGAMIAVRGDRRAVDAVRAVVPGLELAVVNGPRDHVLAGDPAAIAEAGDLLNRRGAVATMLPVRHAFHSAHLEPMLPRFHAMAAKVATRPSRLPLASTVDGVLRPPGTIPGADYFRAQTRGTTRYDRAVATLGAAGCRRFVEIGPGAVLTGLGRRYQPDIPWLPSHCADDGVDDLLATLARLYCAGVPVDWRPLATGSGCRIPLPTYPFQRKTYWVDPRDARSG